MPRPPVSPLAITRLSLTAFRCYAQGTLALDTRPVVLTGPNGAGKTNVLEALSLLAPGRGLRNASFADITRKTPDTDEPTAQSTQDWAVSAVLRRITADGLEDDTKIGTGTTGGEKRVVRINGASAPSAGALSDYVRLAWLTPAMDRLFLEGASGRRRFLDRLVLGAVPDHGTQAAAYERAMRARTKLLKEGGGDPQWLSALEEQMAQHGAALAQARVTFLDDLQRAVDAGAETVFPKADLNLEGTLEDRLRTVAVDQVQHWFASQLRQNRGRDGAAGRALEGPHRSDLLVTHRPKAMPARECSTGEQKALLVGMILGNIRLRMTDDGRPPIVLLDEIAAHLDPARRAALFDEICTLGVQAWMTGTDPELFDALETRAQFIAVADAAFRPAGPPV